jgi:UDP-N-acetylmuramoyl-tripeptide--D-alanyl-D-alanine ligase
MIWTVSDILNAVSGVALGHTAQNTPSEEITITGVAIDSRQVKPGDMFVAIKGDRHDGHDFIASAIENGAAAVMISDHIDLPKPCLSGDAFCVQVEDPMTALERLAIAARDRHQGTRIAITGSVGKTGTRMLVANALAAYGKTHFSEGNLNNHIGTPLSLARMPEDAVFGVFEAGMNHKGELASLSQFIAPKIAIVTQIADSHSGNFPNLEAIAFAKAEIFEGLSHHHNSMAIINADDPFAPLLEQKARDAGAERIIRFGYSDTAEHQIISVRRHRDGLDIEANIRGETHRFQLGMMAPHWAKAVMMAKPFKDFRFGKGNGLKIREVAIRAGQG